MKEPRHLLTASLSVMNALLRDLERQPGADPTEISLGLDHLNRRFAARNGLLGEHMKSGFIEPSRDDARARRGPKSRSAK